MQLLFLLASLVAIHAVAVEAAVTKTSQVPRATAAIAYPTPTALEKRCEQEPCEFGGGPATTLQANTITTTIVSTTSVPCYVTTYVTDSTTYTDTIYSTEIQTETVTHEGTVTVLKYSPTPYLVSSVYESVLQITQTITTFWQETSGSGYETTVTGDTKTIDGGKGGGDGGYVGGGGGGGNKGGTIIQISTADPTGNGNNPAWTHATAAAAGAGVATIDANGAAVTGVAANGNGWAAAAGANTGTNANGVSVNWNAAGGKCSRVSEIAVVALTFVVIMLFEVVHYTSM